MWSGRKRRSGRRFRLQKRDSDSSALWRWEFGWARCPDVQRYSQEARTRLDQSYAKDRYQTWSSA